MNNLEILNCYIEGEARDTVISKFKSKNIDIRLDGFNNIWQVYVHKEWVPCSEKMKLDIESDIRYESFEVINKLMDLSNKLEDYKGQTDNSFLKAADLLKDINHRLNRLETSTTVESSKNQNFILRFINWIIRKDT